MHVCLQWVAKLLEKEGKILTIKGIFTWIMVRDLNSTMPR